METGWVVRMVFAAQECFQHLAGVFERMIKIDDLGGGGKAKPAPVGQSRGPVDEQHHWLGATRAAPDRLLS